jgi:ankyrin repeat protein
VASLAGNHFQIAELLYHHGADPDVRAYNKSNPLHFASGRPCPEILQRLFNHGADSNVRENYLSWTLLLPAANVGYLEVVRVLVEHNVEINALDDEGQTPFHVASKSSHVNIVLLLLGHSLDVNARDNNCLTLLVLASEVGKLEVVNVLLDRGANVEAKDDVGRTVFQ